MDVEMKRTAREVVNFSKNFVTAIRKAMVHSGLMDEGYSLTIEAETHHLPDKEVLTHAVRISNSEGHAVYECWKYRGEKDWTVIIDEDGINAGRVPDDVRKVQPDKGYPGTAKEGKEELPADGLWLSIFDDDDSWTHLVV